MDSGYKRSFISYAQANKVADNDLLVVDSHYHRGLALTHLYSDRVPEKVRANTSTETALNWLSLSTEEREALTGEPEKVTCNHWDIDGFLAVWSLLNPRIALQHKDELIAAGHLGDFREFDPLWPNCLKGLKICALLNHVERSTFCLPFGNLQDASIEYEVAQRKFDYFLPRFAQWLERIEDYRLMWIDEYSEVLNDLLFIDSGNALIEEHEDLGIAIVRTSKPLHYYASFSRVRSGLVVSIVDSKPYVEAEYKYETGVGRLDRPNQPRIDLRPLAERLTELETANDVHWTFDNLHEGGPALRPEWHKRPLTHEERYQSMSRRFDDCPATQISPEKVVQMVREEVAKNFAMVEGQHQVSSFN